jgi:uncharacterized protein (TIGR02391 family)
MAKRRRKVIREPALRITASRRKLIWELACLLAEIAPATARGRGFCVYRIAEDKGLKKCWREASNKKKMLAGFLERVFRHYPQRPKKVVLAIVEGGINWSARRGRAVTQNDLSEIAAKMEQLGFKVRKEFKKLKLPDPSRVVRPPLDLASAIDRIDLHAALKDDCVTMFKDGHLNEAVRKALERFEKMIQDAVGDHSNIGKDLMGKTFKRENPAIAINDLVTGNDKSEQEGFMHLAMGAMAGMRNLYSHGDVKTMTPMDAFERLCFVSLLFKRVEKALARASSKS